MAPSKSSPKEEALPPRNSKLVAQAKIAPIERKLESQVRSKRQYRAMYQDYVSQCAAYGLKVLHYLLLITFLSNAIQVFVPAHTFNENFFFGIRKSVADRYTSICSKWRDVLGRVFPGGWGIFEVTWGGMHPQYRSRLHPGCQAGPELPDLPPSNFLHECFLTLAPRFTADEAQAIRDDIDDVLASIELLCLQHHKVIANEGVRAWVLGHLLVLAAEDKEATYYEPFNGTA